MTGIAGAEVLGKQMKAAFSDNPAAVSLIEKTLASGRSYSDYEAEIMVKHGSLRPVGLVTSVLTDSEGSSIGRYPHDAGPGRCPGPQGADEEIGPAGHSRDDRGGHRPRGQESARRHSGRGTAHEVGASFRTGAGKSLDEYLEVILKEADRLNNVLEGILDFTRLKPREMKGLQYSQYSRPGTAPERGERKAERGCPLAGCTIRVCRTSRETRTSWSRCF